jgi:hypothetical protein
MRVKGKKKFVTISSVNPLLILHGPCHLTSSTGRAPNPKENTAYY